MKSLTPKKLLLLSLLSAALLSLGWVCISGFTLLVALVPLLIISRNYSGSARDTVTVALWAALLLTVIMMFGTLAIDLSAASAVPTTAVSATSSAISASNSGIDI